MALPRCKTGNLNANNCHSWKVNLLWINICLHPVSERRRRQTWCIIVVDYINIQKMFATFRRLAELQVTLGAKSPLRK